MNRKNVKLKADTREREQVMENRDTEKEAERYTSPGQT